MLTIIEEMFSDSELASRLAKARRFDAGESLQTDDDYALNWLYATDAIRNNATTWLRGGGYNGKTNANIILEWFTLNDGENFWRLSKHIWTRDRFKTHTPKGDEDDLAYDRRMGIHKNIELKSTIPEKNIARLMVDAARKGQLFRTEMARIGRPLNFEVPLFEKDNEPYDCIDLVSYLEDEAKMFLLELKRPKSSESLLRCILEIYTYIKAIGDWRKFIADFNDAGRGIKIADDTILVACPLVFMDLPEHERSIRKADHSIPYYDFVNLRKDENFSLLISLINQDLRENVFHDEFDHFDFAFVKETDPVIGSIIDQVAKYKA